MPTGRSGKTAKPTPSATNPPTPAVSSSDGSPSISARTPLTAAPAADRRRSGATYGTARRTPRLIQPRTAASSGAGARRNGSPRRGGGTPRPHPGAAPVDNGRRPPRRPLGHPPPPTPPPP